MQPLPRSEQPTAPLRAPSRVSRHGSANAKGPRLGRYKVLNELGRGASATVHCAIDSVLGRRVALKLPRIHEDMDAEIAAIRLREEGSILAQLQHRCLPTAFEFGVQDEQPYLAMSLVEGPNLRRYIEAKDPRVREVVRVGVQIARGLSLVHAVGFVHRDVKPENILVRAGEASAVAGVLIDFGLCVPRRPSVPGALRRPSAFGVGTHGYAAPEQLNGAPAQPPADQHALCASLHELVFGSRSHDEVSSRLVRQPRLQRLHEVLVRGLAPAPTQRWRSTDVLADALEASAAGTQLRVSEVRNIRR